MPSLRAYEISRRIIGDSFRAIYSRVVSHNKLHVVASDRRMQLPGAIRETIIRYIKDRQCGAQHSRPARVVSLLSFSLSACTHTHMYSVTVEKQIITRRTTNVGEVEFIVTSDFVSVIFRRESSSRSHRVVFVYETSRVVCFDRFSESNSRFQRKQTALYFYRGKHKLANIHIKIQPYEHQTA